MWPILSDARPLGGTEQGREDSPYRCTGGRPHRGRLHLIHQGSVIVVTWFVRVCLIRSMRAGRRRSQVDARQVAGAGPGGTKPLDAVARSMEEDALGEPIRARHGYDARQDGHADSAERIAFSQLPDYRQDNRGNCDLADFHAEIESKKRQRD